jgi:hypothetical protein
MLENSHYSKQIESGDVARQLLKYIGFMFRRVHRINAEGVIGFVFLA